MKNEATFADVNVLFAKKRIGSIGARARQLPEHERDEEDGAHGQRDRRPRGSSTPGRCPARDPRRSRAGRRWPDRGPAGRARRRAVRLIAGDATQAARATRPIGTLIQKIHCHDRPSSDRAADERAERDRQAADAAPGTERDPRRSAGTAALRIVRVSGATIAPPTPWSARARSSTSIVGASAAQRRRAVKIARPDDEHPPAPEPVAERRAGQEQHGERQRVRVDRPLELLDATRRDRCGSPGVPSSRRGCRA